MLSADSGGHGDDLLVIEAPAESAPNSPEAERFNNANKDDFFGHSEADEADTEERRSGLDERRYDRPSSMSDTASINRQDSQEKPPSHASDHYTKQDKDSSGNSIRDDSSSDKEDIGSDHGNSQRQSRTFGDGLEGLSGTAAADTAVLRPPPPARTSSAASDRRSSRIPAPVSPVLQSSMRKPRDLKRQSSNLSAASGIESASGQGPGGSPGLGSADWAEQGTASESNNDYHVST
jgi:hypothetical protein